jgi:hypothetical protein
MFDLSTLPITSMTFLTAAGYAATMAVIGGPLVADRELIRDGWAAECVATLRADLEVQRAPPRVTPVVPDACGMMAAAIPEMGDLCKIIPNPNDALRQTARLRQQAEDARIAAAASKTSDRCGCAEAVYVEENRLALALYAGSGRLITPAPVKNREAALSRALRSPACRGEG